LLLRASGRTQDRNYDLSAVIGATEGGGVPDGNLLIAFAEAVLGEDDRALARARQALIEAAGPSGLVDAAAVVGLFNAIDRVADVTGIPLEPEKAAASGDFRAALDLDRFALADRT
jgi:hypothetical protein